MRDSLKEWCDTTEISVEHINHLACEAAENYVDVDTAYLSSDLFSELLKEMANVAKFAGFSVANTGYNSVSIMTVVGPIQVKAVSGLMNFCHVGNESTYNRLEWIKIDRIFEEEILSV
jgi:hypothetical protein